MLEVAHEALGPTFEPLPIVVQPGEPCVAACDGPEDVPGILDEDGAEEFRGDDAGDAEKRLGENVGHEELFQGDQRQSWHKDKWQCCERCRRAHKLCFGAQAVAGQLVPHQPDQSEVPPKGLEAGGEAFYMAAGLVENEIERRQHIFQNLPDGAGDDRPEAAPGAQSERMRTFGWFGRRAFVLLRLRHGYGLNCGEGAVGDVYCTAWQRSANVHGLALVRRFQASSAVLRSGRIAGGWRMTNHCD